MTAEIAPVCGSATCTPGETPTDFSPRRTYSYMVGVYLAANAVRDGYLLVDGPDCAYMKSEYIQGNQDYLSALVSVSGFHRVANTALHPSQIAGSREDTVRSLLQRMAAHPETGGVLFTSMPCTFITGVDYDRLCRTVQQASGRDVVHIPGNSLSNDWLRGYEEVLNALARQVRLDDGEPDPNRVGIVGYLFDRNEEDNRGNVRELARILSALGLHVSSVWLSGEDVGSLRKISRAGTILSLPYGRKAGKILAERTGRKLIEADLPFGLTATEKWVSEIAQAFGKEKEAARLVDKELSDIVPKLEWVIPFLFQGRSFGYIGDPHLLPGFTEIVSLVGGSVKFGVVTNGRWQGKSAALEKSVGRLLVGPKHDTLVAFLNTEAANGGLDCLVTNSAGLTCTSDERHPVVEFGFPSYNTHALYDRPWLGFRGFLAFVDTMANTMRIHRVFNRGRR